MKKKVLFVLVVVFLVSVTGFMIYQGVKGSEEPKHDEELPVATTTRKTDKTTVYVNRDATLADITKEDGVVNVYMFWGSGCPHCKAQWEYIESIRKKYPGEFAVYGFEIWGSEKNKEILEKFVTAIGRDYPEAVPFTIIGNKVISGFSSGEKTGPRFLQMIEDAKKSGVDVYFDKVKK